MLLDLSPVALCDNVTVNATVQLLLVCSDVERMLPVEALTLHQGSGRNSMWLYQHLGVFLGMYIESDMITVFGSCENETDVVNAGDDDGGADRLPSIRLSPDPLMTRRQEKVDRRTHQLSIRHQLPNVSRVPLLQVFLTLRKHSRRGVSQPHVFGDDGVHGRRGRHSR